MRIIRIGALWCSSCVVTYKEFKKLMKDYPEFEYQELDYDMDDISEYRVGTILPEIIIYDKKEIGRIIGEKKEEDIILYLKEKGII